MKKLAIILFSLSQICSAYLLQAQTPYATTTADITLVGGPGSGTNRSGVAYNPNLDIYYANIAGNATFNFETFSNTGVLLSTVVSNIDIRGVWWNPNLNQLEINAYNSAGIHQKTLDANGYATATNVTIFAANAGQPNIQSSGTYDYVNDHIIYFNNNQITRVNRTTNTVVSTNTITGLPATSLTSYSVGYFNVPNYEIALYDYTNKRVYFVNGTTYAYTYTTQLPTTALANSQFNVGWANNRIFLCNTSARTWTGYPLFPDKCYTVVTNNVNICDNQSYTVGNNTYTTSGTYADTFAGVGTGSCDSVVNTILTVNPTYHTEYSDSMYFGESYTFHNRNLTASGKYVATYNSLNGCDSNITLNLKVIPFTKDTFQFAICAGDTASFENYRFSRAGLYRDTTIASWGHQFRTFIVTVNPKPIVRISNINELQDLCIGDTITIKLTGADTFRWQYIEQPSNRTFHEGDTLLTKVYGFETHYVIKGISDKNCETNFNLTINGKNCCELFIPNAFTPNADGLNDYFEVLGHQPMQYYMEIFDRYGQRVFLSEKVSDKWNGKSYTGEDLNAGVYYYYIKGQCYDGSAIDQKGSITIIR